MAAVLKHLVVTAVGADRPGLVQEISEALHRAGTNIEDSRMAILGGEFAVILLAAGSADAIERVRGERERLEQRLGLGIFLKDTQGVAEQRGFLLYELRISGVDRSGIVSRITSILAGRRINLASLESRIQYAPHSGTPLFSLRADLQVPSELALSELRRTLAAACDEENLDYHLEAG